MEDEVCEIMESDRAQEIWSHEQCNGDYDSDSNPFTDERSIAKIKPEVELKEETEGFVYKADTSGHLKLVCSDSEQPSASELNHSLGNSASNHYDEPSEFKVSDKSEAGNLGVDISTEAIDDARFSASYSSFGAHALMSFPVDQKYIDEFQVSQTDYLESTHQKLFSIDESFPSRCCTDLSEGCENKLSYGVEISNSFTSKQLISQIQDANENSWMYNMQAMRLTEEEINAHTHELSYGKNMYDGIVDSNKRLSSEGADLWQLYQELLAQKKMEWKLAQTEEQKREKIKEIGRIRARLYRFKLKQNDELWKKHKALRAQKQREERLKMSEEQREKIKALARLRAKKHREKLKENEETWKKYKEMRAEKQRLERMKEKEHIKEGAQQLRLLRLAEQSEKTKELARERAKKHRERLKEDLVSWHLYKEARAQKKREERSSMSSDQRERLKELARVRARKYREKLKENSIEWQKYKEMRAQKQREERLKLSEEQKLKAKALARERARVYREKKRMRQEMIDIRSDTSDVSPSWFENNSEGNNCSLYFYHTLQAVGKNIIE